jgi:ribosomal protein S20
MANRRCAVKRLRVDAKRHERNLKIKRELKKAIKTFQSLVTEKNSAEPGNSITKSLPFSIKPRKRTSSTRIWRAGKNHV